MKQNSVVSLIIIAFAAGIISLIASKYLVISSAQQQSAVIVPVITANFPTPSSSYFNSQSIDPTQLIQIGTTTNTNPFSSPSQ
jgi:hypothetical protein